MADRVYSGILKEIREINGVKLVVVGRPSSGVPDLFTTPEQFPSEQWISENLGKPIYLVVREGVVREIKAGVDPDAVLTVTLVGERVAVTCPTCEEVVCHAPMPGTVDADTAREAMRPFVEHIKKRHPDEFERIRKLLE